MIFKLQPRIHYIQLELLSHMANMKCVSCGISFFSPMGADTCSRCTPKESHGHDHGSCGCGHSH